jgi:hypothetical protein
MSQDALRMIHFSYVHSIITYGVIFWGNLPHSIKIFRIKKNNKHYYKQKELGFVQGVI